jgi:hypothetical protein
LKNVKESLKGWGINLRGPQLKRKKERNLGQPTRSRNFGRN